MDLRLRSLGFASFLVLAACGGSVEEPSSSGDPSETRGTPTSAGAGNQNKPVNPGGTGADRPADELEEQAATMTFHIENEVNDEINVSLETDGTFRFLFNECDAMTGSCGRWTPGKDGYSLEPMAGAKSFKFYDREHGLVEAKLVTIVPLHEIDSAKLHVLTDTGEMFTSEWGGGRVCAVCVGDGPGEVEACDAPLTNWCE